MDMTTFAIAELIAILAQFLLFAPFFFVWIGDCKSIGRENLAVPLKTRFANWCIFFPIWLFPFLVNWTK